MSSFCINMPVEHRQLRIFYIKSLVKLTLLLSKIIMKNKKYLKILARSL